MQTLKTWANVSSISRSRQGKTTQSILGNLDLAFATIHSTVGTGKYWSDGWGIPEDVRRLLDVHSKRMGKVRAGSLYTNEETLPSIQWKSQKRVAMGKRSVLVQDGSFATPINDGTLPPESRTARFQLLSPELAIPGSPRPAWVHLSGTGDQGYGMRRDVGALLLQQGVSSIVLESAYYGTRRPKRQTAGKLRRVSDMLSLGNATIEETLLMLRWLRAAGFWPLGICGFSMGGVNAVLAAACCREFPVGVVTLCAPYSAVPVYLEGALARACDWRALQRDLGPASSTSTPGAISSYAARRAAEERMAQILTVTDLRRVPPPPVPAATILLQADDDAYVPTDSPEVLAGAWATAEKPEIRRVNGGHVWAFLAQRRAFAQAIIDASDSLSGRFAQPPLSHVQTRPSWPDRLTANRLHN
mmetsp:Transcript_67055/g.179232  ORF Transcript_67055/g.179232 Transcript_67055/m.179232 type:complete len:416 (-) Transcript_67055:126-1373(-)